MRQTLAFDVNGQSRSLELDTRTTLLDVLREHLHLTGAKKGCDHRQCGVAPRPWRVEAADALLPRGTRATVDALLTGARATSENLFKLTLVERTLASVLAEARA